MKTNTQIKGMEKLPTGIAGLDWVCDGGFPKNRTTLVCGTAGSGKTLFAAQFLAEGIQQTNESGLFVTFEESPDDIRNNVGSLGWNVPLWEKQKKWVFVNASPRMEEQVVGEYDLTAFLVRIEKAIKEVNAKRVVIDSLGAIFSQFTIETIVRRELFRIVNALKEMGITSMMTAERDTEYGRVSRHSVEEFVADNVIILRNVLDQERRRRTLEVLKLRGSSHQKGECPFTILPKTGLELMPISFIALEQKSTSKRIRSGKKEVDDMCGGGFFRDSIILVSGPTGTGKTLLASEFIMGGAKSGERSLYFAFEESHEQLSRNATSWGMDFDELEKTGKLKMVCCYPETANLEEHLINMKRVIEEFKPQRIAVDSLSALERTAIRRGFRDFVLCLTAFIKKQQIAGLFTSTSPSLLGGLSVTEAHISTITDSIILLRYLEMAGEMRRGITVLKMRGSKHDKEIREYTIDEKGLHIGAPVNKVTGILTGHLKYLSKEDALEMSMSESEA
ncbi:MAG: putative circadian clock protein KaiC [Verrucomicrobiales bacterium]|nr:putative circadian clock protein KaiC [Verrucomicrobiales bacterium]